jgi:hypothetical protein
MLLSRNRRNIRQLEEWKPHAKDNRMQDREIGSLMTLQGCQSSCSELHLNE